MSEAKRGRTKRKTTRSQKASGIPQSSCRPHHTTEKTDEREAFALWLATPPPEREPKTQRELAKQLAVNNATLSTWKGDPKIVARVRALGGYLLGCSLGRILGNLLRASDNLNLDAIREALNLTGFRVIPAGGSGSTVNVALGGDPEEVSRLQREILDRREGVGIDYVRPLVTAGAGNGNGNGKRNGNGSGRAAPDR